MSESLSKDGYTILPNVFDATACCRFGDDVARALQSRGGDAIEAGQGRVVGGRNLLSLWDGWRSITDANAVQTLIQRELGANAGVVRILYFDKPPGQGWALSMHKDKTIAVQQHVQPPDPFAKPTTKAGVAHVEATRELLDRMITLRIHLDAMHDDNGPLVVIPGSHEVENDLNPVTIHCSAGDVFVMKPLLSHSSKAADPNTKDHRRVIHLELAPSDELPGSYQWYGFAECVNGPSTDS